jgi:hypothetical protein
MCHCNRIALTGGNPLDIPFFIQLTGEADLVNILTLNVPTHHIITRVNIQSLQQAQIAVKCSEDFFKIVEAGAKQGIMSFFGR